MTSAGSPLLIHRLAAFTDRPDGGNPAGVVVTDAALPAETMQRIAAQVGYSETAFLSGPTDDRRRWLARYFAPETEVPFCGHATIAAGVLLAELVGPGAFQLDTPAGAVALTAGRDADGRQSAALTSVEPSVEAAGDLLGDALRFLGYGPAELDGRFPPAIADAGARHLIVVLADRAALARLDYDFHALRALMQGADLTTVALLWREADGRFHARNPFPVGGVVEDPATGAAAAAFGAYLRAGGHVDPPAALEIIQGEDMGRPSLLRVEVPPGRGGITVAGGAVPITVA